MFKLENGQYPSKWSKDRRASEIAESTVSEAEQIEMLGRHMYGGEWDTPNEQENAAVRTDQGTMTKAKRKSKTQAPSSKSAPGQSDPVQPSPSESDLSRHSKATAQQIQPNQTKSNLLGPNRYHWHCVEKSILSRLKVLAFEHVDGNF
jgi:hypothetical protein